MASTASGHSADRALERKDKMRLPIPVSPTVLESIRIVDFDRSFVVGDTDPRRYVNSCSLCSPNIEFVLGLLYVYCQSLYSGSSSTVLIPYLVEFQWSVLQYVIIRPAASIAGIICEAFDVLCENDGYSWRYASVWIEGINFVSIRSALFCLW